VVSRVAESEARSYYGNYLFLHFSFRRLAMAFADGGKCIKEPEIKLVEL